MAYSELVKLGDILRVICSQFLKSEWGSSFKSKNFKWNNR